MGAASGKPQLLSSDSRQLIEKKVPSVFFARRGAIQDGHDYLTALSDLPFIQAFVVERIPENFKSNAPVVVVRDSTLAMALAVKDFYGDPTKTAFTAAVTGTNGKTTTTFLLQSLLRVRGDRPVRSGTIETQFEDFVQESTLTTPDFSVLQQVFSKLKERGANAFVFEASSHALDQKRLLGFELDMALFTNLTPEHLDYHRSMDEYYLAKQKLFIDLLGGSQKSRKIAVVPRDGAYGSRLIHDISSYRDIDLWTWGFDGIAGERNLLIETWSTSLEGSEMKVSGGGVNGQSFKTRLVGRYNIENVAGMLGAGLALGVDAARLQRALDELSPVSGRLERVKTPQGHVFVDYAHTPDALENVLMTLRPLTKGKLRVVFGCGGDRDRKKRPQMGALAELYADEIFVTSDNPRTENPESIIEEILVGMQRLKPIHIDVDRRSSILKSLDGLSSRDALLIAGKGHETYQILGTTKIHFDDREVVLQKYNRHTN